MDRILHFFRRNILFLACLFFGFAFRYYLLYLREFNYSLGDTGFYLKYAYNLYYHFTLSGQDLPPIMPEADRTPVLPFFIVLTSYIWKLPIIASVYAQIVLSCFSSLILYKITYHMTKNNLIANISMVLFTFCPALALYSVVLVGESISIFFFLCLIYFLMLFIDFGRGKDRNIDVDDRFKNIFGNKFEKRSYVYLFLISIFSVLIIFCKPNWSVIAIIISLIFLYYRKNFKYIILYGAFIAMFIFSWSVRNYYAYGHYIGIRTIHGGIAHEWKSPWWTSENYQPYRKWLTTWMYSSKDFELFWKVTDSIGKPIEEINAAFSSAKEKKAIMSIMDSFKGRDIRGFSDNEKDIFNTIADKKIAEDPLKYHVLLPLKRSLYMFESRHVAVLPINLKQQNFILGFINFFYYIGFFIGFFVIGILVKRREINYKFIALSFVVVAPLFHGFLKYWYILALDPRYIVQLFIFYSIFSSVAIYYMYDFLRKRMRLFFSRDIYLGIDVDEGAELSERISM
ncbi:MAG: hypothetical protein HQK49_08905 [Oligoflexia bacterium]|nr:hypothetical protein [Oligoflexia bacterium]